MTRPAAPGASTASHAGSRPRDLPFLLLWGGQSVSAVGDGMALLAIPLLVLQQTSDPVLAALAATPQTIGYLLSGLVAGALVDRLDTRRVMLACDTARLAVFTLLTALALAGAAPVWVLLGLAVVAAVFGVLFDTAHAAMLQGILAPAHLVAGNSRLELSTQLGVLAGPALAGAIAAGPGAGVCLLVNAASYGVSVVTLWLLPRDAVRRERGSGLSVRRAAGDLREGLSYLRRHRLVRAVCGLQVVVNLLLAVETLIVFFAVHTLGGGPAGASVALAAGAGGGVLGASIAGPLGRRVAAPTLISGALLVLAGALAAASAAPSVAWLAAANLVIGLTSVLATVHIRALRQRVVPPELIGRVTATARTLAVAAYPLGAVLAGQLTAMTGQSPRVAFAVAGLLGAGAVVVGHRTGLRPAAQTTT
ncbi:MFS transporter [Microbispora sp. H11081]|uniref:MFS transporter n=1 Tax=Microbispora sp. H11081 TaxID=2729107 RepID=UPI00147614C4|nr:MFS transporter [Microbispora sp. H11081]